MGYVSDRLPDRRLLVVACAAIGAVAYGLIYFFPTQPVYIVAFCAILPFGGALFSQTFSFARVYYDLRRPGRAEFMTSALRTSSNSAKGRPLIFTILSPARRPIWRPRPLGTTPYLASEAGR